MAKVRKLVAFVAFTFLVCVSSLSTRAQSYYDEPQRLFYGGLVAGANFTQIDGDNFAGYRKVGANVGGIVYAQLANKLAASMEILFVQKGSRSNTAQMTPFKDPIAGQPIRIDKYNIDLNYAEIPIMINYFDKRKSNFGLGFSYSQLISTNEKLLTAPTLATETDPSTYSFRRADLNILAGVNLKLVGGLFLNVRFQYSLLPIRAYDDRFKNYMRKDQFNNLYVLRLMYLFNK
ncbi:MAG: PorT family protein [Sphingobacteriales bacterium]|nr:MAG: PorT family protein [Sphingobacteriales bacterium]